MIRKWSVKYPGATGTENRHVYVYLPADYEEHPDRRYPVLYMFDGQNVFFNKDASFGKSWGLGWYLDRIHAPLIVAALECNRNPNNARLSEYSPFDWTDSQYGRFRGKGERTMQWFINRFKPHIDRTFRTLPDREHTWICGSSMGGLMSLYAISVHNDVFGKAAALSPTLDADIEQLCSLLQESDFAQGTVIYMDYGSEEFESESFQPDNYARVCDLLFRKGTFLTSRVVPYGDHSEASWERQLPFVIKTLLY